MKIQKKLLSRIILSPRQHHLLRLAHYVRLEEEGKERYEWCDYMDDLHELFNCLHAETTISR